MHCYSYCQRLHPPRCRENQAGNPSEGVGVFAYQAYHPCDKVYQVYQTRCLSKVAVPVAAEDKN